MTLTLPPEVEAVLHQFRTTEFSTIGKDGLPLAWPVTAAYRPEEGTFVIATSIGLPQKAFNIRRNPKVSLLFSEPKASGLHKPPAVLVQGDAVVPDELTSAHGLEDLWKKIYSFQASSQAMGRTRFGRWLFDWYFMRLRIIVTPCRVAWWPQGDFSLPPQEVLHVG